MPSKRGEMKRVQSEGGNLHTNGLDEDPYGIVGGDIYGNYGIYSRVQAKPVMGVHGNGVMDRKPPPPNYGGPSSSPAVDFNGNSKVHLRPKKHGNEVGFSLPFLSDFLNLTNHQKKCWLFLVSKLNRFTLVFHQNFE